MVWTTQPCILSSYKNLINHGCAKKCNAGACKSFETNQRQGCDLHVHLIVLRVIATRILKIVFQGPGAGSSKLV